MTNLKERVFQYRSLQLPGQPIGMHMGTSYLIDDLWRRIGEAEGLLRGARDFTPVEYQATIDAFLNPTKEAPRE